MGDALVESLKQPEAAVAYTRDYLFERAAAAGFGEIELLHGEGVWQPLLTGRKLES
jgi:hypothetical protein